MKKLLQQKDTRKWIVGFAVMALCVLLFELKFTRELMVIVVEKAMHSEIDHDYWRRFILLKTLYPAIIVMALYVDVFFARTGKIRQLIPANILCFFALAIVNVIANGDFIGYAGGYWDNQDWIEPAISGFGANTLYSSHYPPLMVMIFRITRYMCRTMYEGTSLYAMNFVHNLVLLFTLVCLALELSDYMKVIKGKNWYVLAMFLSMPMLVALERMNTVFIALVFIVYFLKYYESADAKKRYLAALSLAFATNLKYYPVMYGALLLKRKKWKEAIVCAVAGIAMFVLPALVPKDATVLQNQYYLQPYQYGVIEQYKDYIEDDAIPEANATEDGKDARDTAQIDDAAELSIERNNVSMVASAGSSSQTGIVGGIRNIFEFEIKNITEADISLWSVVLTICRLLHIGGGAALAMQIIMVILWAAVTTYAFIKVKRRDLEYALIGLFIVMIIPNTFWYVGILLIPALMEFIIRKDYVKYDIFMGLTWIVTMLFYIDFEGTVMSRAVNKWFPLILWIVVMWGVMLEIRGTKKNLKLNEALDNRELGA